MGMSLPAVVALSQEISHSGLSCKLSLSQTYTLWGPMRVLDMWNVLLDKACAFSASCSNGDGK